MLQFLTALFSAFLHLWFLAAHRLCASFKLALLLFRSHRSRWPRGPLFWKSWRGLLFCRNTTGFLPIAAENPPFASDFVQFAGIHVKLTKCALTELGG